MQLRPHNLDSEDRSPNRSVSLPGRNPRSQRNTLPPAPPAAAREGRAPQIQPASTRAFTLIEMLVVLAIIGLLAALTLPHIRGHSESVAIDAAARQLMDDIAYARLRAISQRGTVAIVFIGPDMLNFFSFNTIGSYNAIEQATVKRLHGGALTHYALYEYRKAGEQPGSFDSHGYITEWKSLPEKTFIDPQMFSNPETVTNSFYHNDSKFPFPLTTPKPSPTVANLHHIAFDLEGRCIKIEKDETGSGKPGRNVAIQLARGSILYTREADGSVLPANFDAQQIPPGNSTSTVIDIDAITGRAKRIEPQLP